MKRASPEPVGSPSVPAKKRIEFTEARLVHATAGPLCLLDRSITVSVMQNAMLRWDAISEFHLVDGAIHVVVAAGGNIRLDTEFGSIESVDAEFLVTADLVGVEIEVRSGTVKFRGNLGDCAIENRDSDYSILLSVFAGGMCESVERRADD